MTGPVNFCLGRDYEGTLSDVTFAGTPGSADAAVAWTLYDGAEAAVGAGPGSYVSPGVYQFVVPASAFDAQVPDPRPGHYTTGRLAVTVEQGGVRGAFGFPVRFVWPSPAAQG